MQYDDEYAVIFEPIAKHDAVTIWVMSMKFDSIKTIIKIKRRLWPGRAMNSTYPLLLLPSGFEPNNTEG